jgi:hypothetical protein
MRIMLDECITQGAANAIITFLALDHPPVEAHFVVGYFGRRGMKDHQIADTLHKEGDWCVITGDRGRHSSSAHKRMVYGPPMHEILPNKGVSAVYLSGNIQQAPSTEKVRAVVAVWEDIKKFFQTGAPGDRKLLTKHGDRFLLKPY